MRFAFSSAIGASLDDLIFYQETLELGKEDVSFCISLRGYHDKSSGNVFDV